MIHVIHYQIVKDNKMNLIEVNKTFETKEELEAYRAELKVKHENEIHLTFKEK